VIQNGGSFESDATFTIGDNGAIGMYEINGGTLRTASDGAANFRVGRNGGQGILRAAGSGAVIHGDVLTLADGSAGTSGRIEFFGSNASVTIARLDNLASGASETLHWTADASGITPLVINGTSGANRVQLQDPSEVSTNSGANGGGNLMGDGTALSLNLSALAGNHTLTLIDNQTSQPIVGFFEHGQSLELFEEGEAIPGTGFNGLVTISYVGGAGNNDVVLSLVASTTILGDHNADGSVDAADYVIWRKRGIHGLLGYSQWRSNFGDNQSDASGSQVPEPTTASVIVIGFALAGFGRHPWHGTK
jgi:hypothetical protein